MDEETKNISVEPATIVVLVLIGFFSFSGGDDAKK